MGGTWAGTLTLTDVTGGDCLAPSYAFIIGVPFEVFPFPISQAGDTLTMNFSPFFSSSTCPYSGVATATGFTQAAANCATPSPRRCEDGRVRDVSFVSATMSGTVNGGAASVTQIETWNVYLAGTQTSVGPLTLTTSLKLVR